MVWIFFSASPQLIYLHILTHLWPILCKVHTAYACATQVSYWCLGFSCPAQLI